MKIKSFISLVLFCAIAGGVTLAQAQSPSKEQTIGFIVETLNKCDASSRTFAISSDEVMMRTRISGRTTKIALKHIGSVHSRAHLVLSCRGEEASCVEEKFEGATDHYDAFVITNCPVPTVAKLEKAFTHLLKFYDAENKSLF